MHSQFVIWIMDNAKHFSRTYTLFADGDTWKDLQSRFSQRNNDTVIQDVWDGSEYRKHSAFLSQPTHISFQLNTDGVALFKSSKVNFWPVWLVINELPKARRLVIISLSTFNLIVNTFTIMVLYINLLL